VHKHRRYIPETVDQCDVKYCIDFADGEGEMHNIDADDSVCGNWLVD